MKRYYIEVRVWEKHEHGGRYVWKKVRPSRGEPYAFKTLAEADAMARMCYSDHPEESRIICE
jgi:hypothetical protein